MDFVYGSEEEEFRTYVRAALHAPDIAGELARVRAAAGEPDERPLYRLLGRAGLLAPSWPAGYGGGDRGPTAAVVVLEEMIRAGVPDTLYVNGIQTVGQIVLTAGTAEQRALRLPRLADGDGFATVLYTEPDAGSDLASLTTVARSTGDGFEISGTKIYGLKSRFADLGLCAARVEGSGSKYAGITLFLLDMNAPGVKVRIVPGIMREHFHLVELDRVRVGHDSVIGGVGEGWSVLAQALPFERTGVDFAFRAERWFGLACAAGDDPAELERTGRYGARVQAARLLARRAAEAVAAGRLNPLPTATAKWYSSELATELAGWALRRHGAGSPAIVDEAYREAPALTLSGGTSEMMAQLVSGSLLGDVAGGVAEADTDSDLTEDELVLAKALRAELAAAADGDDGVSPQAAGDRVARLGLFGLQAPGSRGGFELGMDLSAVVCEELGRVAVHDRYRSAAFLTDVMAGEVPAGVVDGSSRVEVALLLVGAERPAVGRAGAGPVLSGHCAVPGPSVDHLVVPAVLDGREIFAVIAADTDEVTVRPGARSDLTDVRIDGGAVLATAPAAGPDGDPGPVLIRARIRQAAYLLGLASGAHRLACQWAANRRQFGTAIGDNQAVAFPIARQWADLAALRALIRRACRLCDAPLQQNDPGQGPAADRSGEPAHAATSALAYAADLALEVTGHAVHVHGAFGLTRRSAIHRFYRAAAIEALRWDAPATLWRQAAGMRAGR